METRAAFGPNVVNVTVGAGRDTVAVNAYFPEKVEFRAGDTITWKIDGREIHTVAIMDQGKPVPPSRPPSPGAVPLM